MRYQVDDTNETDTANLDEAKASWKVRELANKLRSPANSRFREGLAGLQQAGITLSETISAAVKKRNVRQRLRETDVDSVTLVDQLAAARCAIPLSTSQDGRYSRLGREKFPRRSNWESTSANTIIDNAGWWVADIDNGRYSSGCTYTHWTYQVQVTSYGIVLGGSRLRVRFATDSRIVIAPHGYYWARDENGIKLVANANARADYHPDAEELLGPVREITRKLRENFRMRKAEARADAATKRQHSAALTRANHEGLQICVADSRRAGNCTAGSSRWAERHGFDPSRHYTAKQLLAVANGDIRRVMLVVHRAMKRHAAEMAAGACLIADHNN